MEVVLRNVRHGDGYRRKYIYADLETPDGDLMIAGTLDYIMKAVSDRGYTLVRGKP